TLGRGTASLRRYWDPFAEDVEVTWLREEDLDHFDDVLRRAVARSFEGGAPSIFLSGGLDSIAVAVAATDLARARGQEPPLALSLIFPDKVADESDVQVGVARQLGLEQVCLPMKDAVGPRGLLAEALEMSAGWPQPMWNIWSPAYMQLATRAAAGGRQLILTGRGGDEWVTVTPYVMADQLRRGDLAGMWRLLAARHRSENLSWRGAARLVWMAAC